MAVRRPVVAGMFYPTKEHQCRREIVACLAEAGQSELASPLIAGIVPHAGWVYSGPTAARVLAALPAAQPETVVLFGAVHHWGVAGPSAYGPGSWRTPLGDLAVDDELAQAAGLSGDPSAHADEHSIEVQLPFVCHLLPQARILPVAVPPIAEAEEVGRRVARAARQLGRRAVAIGSSDLTHYGPRYGMAPAGVGAPALAWIERNDRRLLDLVTQMRAQDVLAEADRHHNACGAGAIAAAIGFAQALGAIQGHLLHYTTSHAVRPMGQATDMVGYGAVAFC